MAAGTAQPEQRSAAASDPAPGVALPSRTAPAESKGSAAAPAFTALAVPGFEPAVVFAPTGDGDYPLVVATHGAGGAPEYECEYWRELTNGRASLLCLRGTPLSRGDSGSYFYKNHHELEREFSAALSVFDRPFKVGVYVGFSQGAIMGAPMIVAHAARFPRLVLIEGGYEYWSRATARKFARNGGKRVLFVCGTKWCNDRAAIPAAWLAQEKVAVRVEYAQGAGHTPGGEVMQLTARALPWVLAE